ncbi:MAG: glycosyltransferase family 2 protein, partial [candidate division Zixibacteria bacterium]|nr:glycosyltransferase family 2 protein [candidate division Zixibacteria bacterium]
MLEEAFKKKASISACMMVKNEEELLPGSLESIRNWVDEIVVVDTGSTDRTVEIAESYGARVYHQPWANDFSLHRNYSTSLATGDWILIIDADERIVEDDVPMLLRAIEEDRFGVISLNVINVYGADESKVTFLNSFRIFKRELDLKYEGIVHN